MDQREQLQVKAAKYRDYVRWISDPDIAESILNLASELERQAMQPDEEDIRTDEEFWLLAEQELRIRPHHYARPTTYE